MTKVLMLGIDGLTWSVLGPAFEAGHLPRLRAVLEGGVSGKLTSTVPPFTPPGWTSIFTGVNPGKHGIFGFTNGNAQRGQQLVRLDSVAAPAIWNAANAQGRKVGLFNIPMTYPPPAVDAWSVSGMMTPEEAGAAPPNFTCPPDLLSGLLEGGADYHIDIEVDYDRDWRSTDITERMARNYEVKRSALSKLLGRNEIDLLFAVFEGPDRLMHVHYKYLDPACEHFFRPEATAIRERTWLFFDQMDEMAGDLLDWCGEDGYVVTMSDHGFQGKDASANVNLALMEWGLLHTSGVGRLAANEGLRRVAGKVKRFLPSQVHARAKTAAVAIDWSATTAFSGPNPQQGVYINLVGREPYGTVSESEYESVREDVIERLLGWVDPADDRPVVDMVHKREDVIHGPLAERAPDLFPVCRGYSYELNDSLYSGAPVTDFRQEPRGFHHMDGIFGLAGPGIEAVPDARATIYDIAPTSLYLAGVDIPEMDGRVLTEHLPQQLLAERPAVQKPMDLPSAAAGAEAAPYTEDEAARIEESLRNLGYL